MGARLAGCITNPRHSSIRSPPRSPRLAARSQQSRASFSKEERVYSPTTRNFKISAISAFPFPEEKKASEPPSLESLPDVPGRELRESSPRHRKPAAEKIPETVRTFTDEMAAATYAIAKDVDVNTPDVEFAVKMKLVEVSAEREVRKAEAALEMMVDEKILVVNHERDMVLLQQKEIQLEQMEQILNEKKDLIKKKNVIQKIQTSKERAQDQQKSLNSLMETIQNLDRKIFKKRCSLVADRKPEAQLECDAYLFTSKFIDFFASFLCCFAFYIPLTLIFILGRICGKFKSGNVKNNTNNSITDKSKSEVDKPPLPSFNISEIPQSYFLWIKIMIFSIFLIIPGTLVVLTQSFCLIKLGELENSSGDSDTFSDLMHALFVVFYFFLSMNEVAASFKVIAYFCKIIYVTCKEESVQDTVVVLTEEETTQKQEDTNKNAGQDKDSTLKIDLERKDTKTLKKKATVIKPRFQKNNFKSYVKIIVLALLTGLRFVPQLVQIAFCFWFCYINIYLIGQISSTTDLIRNFAALAILLEFDTLVMSFLRYLKFKELYDYFYQAILNDEQKGVDFETERQIREDEEELKRLVRDLEIEKFSTNLEINSLDDLVKIITSMKAKVKQKREKLAQSKGNDVIDHFSNFDVENLMNDIPKFMKGYFKSRNEDLQILMSAEKFIIPNKYRMDNTESKIEKKLFNWIGFGIIMIGIFLVVFIFDLQ